VGKKNLREIKSEGEIRRLQHLLGARIGEGNGRCKLMLKTKNRSQEGRALDGKKHGVGIVGTNTRFPYLAEDSNRKGGGKGASQR